MIRRGRRLPARLAERLWRWPLLLAAGLLALCGPATSLGRTGVVLPCALAAVALTALAVPLGLFALRAPAPTTQEMP
jgi:hypothetical protein